MKTRVWQLLAVSIRNAKNSLAAVQSMLELSRISRIVSVRQSAAAVPLTVAVPLSVIHTPVRVFLLLLLRL